MVFRRGKTEAEVGELVHDLRQLMLPYTALNLQENKNLTLSQYAKHLALPMGITHMLCFSQNEERLWLRLARTPEGPTLTFRVLQFSLHRHIVALQRRPVALNTPTLHTNPPIVVTNNFESNNRPMNSTAPHLKLLRITFQNLFCATNVFTVKLQDCRRVALFHYDEENDLVQVRHYAVTATPVGVNRRVRRLVSTKQKLPNLHHCNDIADYLDNSLLAAQSDGGASDSEAEEEDMVVKLSDRFTPGNNKSQTSALKLKEMGPRLTLKLVKVEKGFGGGDVLYHAFVNKTPEETAALKSKKEQEMLQKVQRRAQQEANVERKRQAALEKRLAKRQRQEQAKKDDEDNDSEGQYDADEEDEEVPLKD
jgi:ribosome biogenesis protein SSF1/2